MSLAIHGGTGNTQLQGLRNNFKADNRRRVAQRPPNLPRPATGLVVGSVQPSQPNTAFPHLLLTILVAIAAFLAIMPPAIAAQGKTVAKFVTPAEMRSGSLLLRSEGDRY